MELEAGRRNQKYRTRRALLAAARVLMERKQPVNVADVAAEAGISKATAYRYFATSDALIREAALDGKWKTTEEVISGATEVHDRVQRVNAYLFTHTRNNELAHRLFLSKALGDWVAEGGKPKATLRLGRRIPMFEEALAPVRAELSKKQFRDLVLSLASGSGIESYIALKDVCELDDETADRISALKIAAILDQALAKAR